jgi:hypothetical protein
MIGWPIKIDEAPPASPQSLSKILTYADLPTSASRRNPPKHGRFIATLVAFEITHSSSAKTMVSNVGG